MTNSDHGRAPGDIAMHAEVPTKVPGGFVVYTLGLLIAVVLTAMSFWVANSSLLWAHAVPLGLVVLAVAQMGVHLIFFLHITTGPDNTNNVLALAFGVLIVTIVIGGSVWIMANLNAHMTP